MKGLRKRIKRLEKENRKIKQPNIPEESGWFFSYIPPSPLAEMPPEQRELLVAKKFIQDNWANILGSEFAESYIQVLSKYGLQRSPDGNLIDAEAAEVKTD